MRQPFDDSIGHLSKAEWESTPTSVQQLVGNLLERVEGLEQQIGELRQDNEQLHSENQRLTTENQQLREQVERNWQNSSQPPSQDIARGFKGKEKGKSGRQRGGQAGHPGHERNLYPLEACASVENHYPSHCIACDHGLSGEDAQPLVKSLLKQGDNDAAPSKDKSLRAKTAHTCQQLLKVEPALWLFVTTGGVEPTNNDAERALRPALLWRKSSFGSQSAAGSLFVSRMLTVVTSLRLQQRHVLDFLTQACRAKRLHQPAPCLLPTLPNIDSEVAPAASTP